MSVVAKLCVCFLTCFLVFGVEAAKKKTNKNILERKRKRKAEKIEHEANRLSKAVDKLKKQGRESAVAAVNNYAACIRKLAKAYSEGKLDSVESLEDEIKVAAIRCLCQGYKAKVRLSWRERKYVHLYKSLIGVSQLAADGKDSEFLGAIDEYAKHCVKVLSCKKSDKAKLTELKNNSKELKKKFYSQRKTFVKYKTLWAKLPVAKKRKMMQIAFNKHQTDFADTAAKAEVKPAAAKPESKAPAK